MTETIYSLTLITAIGPNAWYILGILVAIGQPLAQRRLCAIAKLSKSTVAMAVENLIEYRLAARVGRYAVQATTHARQMVLGESHTQHDSSPATTKPELIDSTAKSVEKPVENRSGGIKFSPRVVLEDQNLALPHVVVVEDPSESELEIQQQQHDSAKAKNLPSLAEAFFQALRAGEVWPDSARPLAARLAAGEIPLTLDDVLGIVVQARDLPARNLGALVHHNVSAGKPAPPASRPPTTHLASALKWARMSRAERCAARWAWEGHCPACSADYFCDEWGAESTMLCECGAALIRGDYVLDDSIGNPQS